MQKHGTATFTGTGLWWAIVLACVSAFQALTINAYFFRLFRITCQLKVVPRDTSCGRSVAAVRSVSLT